jgi:hypothetical protein
LIIGALISTGARFHWTELQVRGSDFEAMMKSDESHALSWPWWAPWALLAVAVTSLLTLGATLYDIL